jgi:two-component system sensor histidine kinase VanS
VWVTTRVHAEAAVLTVENTGETLAPELVSTLVEPFQRGAERIRPDLSTSLGVGPSASLGTGPSALLGTGHAGVGLGLAIVKSIAQAHDGTLMLTPRPAGGLRVTVTFPAAPHTVGR